ncbi:MAG: ABC transporter permease subunit, partial [Ruminococcus sp.]|nr:ABC transporter permease subunit [Ruminococcus sp.]
SRIFLGGAAATMLMPLLITFASLAKNTVSGPLDGVYDSGLQIIWLVIGLTVSMFIGTDYDNKTINNKIMSGHPRAAIYLADLIVTYSGVVLMQVCGIVIGSAAAIPLFGMFSVSFKEFILSELFILCILAVYTAIVLFITTIFNSKAHAQAVSMVTMLVVFAVGNIVYDQMVRREMNEHGSAAAAAVSQPSHEQEKDVWEVLYDLVPQCQTNRVLEAGGLPDDAAKMAGFDVAVITVITAAGIFVFCKKDIK